MANIRNKTHPKGYTVLDNRGLDCPNISFRATGLWAYIKSKPDSWEVSVSHLAKQKSEGRDAIYKAIAELIEAGLVLKTQSRDSGKFSECNYDFYDFPQKQLPLTENPQPPLTGKPDTVLPCPVNPTLVITHDLTITDRKTTTQLSDQEKKSERGGFEKWLINKFSNDPTVRNAQALTKHVLQKGNNSPEYQDWQEELNPSPVEESRYAHLWSQK